MRIQITVEGEDPLCVFVNDAGEETRIGKCWPSRVDSYWKVHNYPREKIYTKGNRRKAIAALLIMAAHYVRDTYLRRAEAEEEAGT